MKSIKTVLTSVLLLASCAMAYAGSASDNKVYFRGTIENRLDTTINSIQYVTTNGAPKVLRTNIASKGTYHITANDKIEAANFASELALVSVDLKSDTPVFHMINCVIRTTTHDASEDSVTIVKDQYGHIDCINNV